MFGLRSGVRERANADAGIYANIHAADGKSGADGSQHILGRSCSDGWIYAFQDDQKIVRFEACHCVFTANRFPQRFRRLLEHGIADVVAE